MPKRFRRQRTVGQRGQRDHFGPLLAELQQLNKVLADVNSKFSAGAKEDPDKEISIKDKKVCCDCQTEFVSQSIHTILG
jgi:hypothetical protein